MAQFENCFIYLPKGRPALDYAATIRPSTPDHEVIAAAQVIRPRIAYVATASGDADHVVVDFYSRFARFDCIPSDISLLSTDTSRVSQAVSDADILYVGDGVAADLVAVWTATGFTDLLKKNVGSAAVIYAEGAGACALYEYYINTTVDGTRLLSPGVGLFPGYLLPNDQDVPQALGQAISDSYHSAHVGVLLRRKADGDLAPVDWRESQ